MRGGFAPLIPIFMERKEFVGIAAKVVVVPGLDKLEESLSAFAIAFGGHLPNGDLGHDYTFGLGEYSVAVWYAIGNVGQQKAGGIVDVLQLLAEQYRIASYGGLKSDLRLLSEISGRTEACRRLAIEHHDVGFHLLCRKGWQPSINSVLEGSSLSALSLTDVLPLGHVDHKPNTISYLAERSSKIVALARVLDNNLTLKWESRRSRPSNGSPKQHQVYSLEGSLSVAKCLDIEKPDVSWMVHRTPETRESCLKWVRRIAAS